MKSAMVMMMMMMMMVMLLAIVRTMLTMVSKGMHETTISR